MIFEVQSYYLIFQDAIYSMAVGFMVGFINQLLSVFLYKGKRTIFLRDIIISVIFTVLLFSYTVSFANYKVLRWYNVLFALIGRVLFTPCFSMAGNMLLKLVGVFAKETVVGFTKPIVKKVHILKEKNIKKKQKITQKNQDKVLKEEDILLYN